MIDLDRLRALHAVSVHGTVSGAAEALHVTTSAVSQQLAKLERETGHKLLERHGRGVRLTDAAALLVGHAERILAMVETAQADLEAHRGVVGGELVIGAFATAVRGLLPGALLRLRAGHPDLRVRLCEMDPAQGIPLVERGDLDVVVVQDWRNQPMAPPPGLSSALLCEDVADVALPASHPLAGRDEIGLDELRGDPWIASTENSVCAAWLMYTLRSSGVEPRIDHTAYEFDSQLALVAAGLGNAIVPRLGRCPVPASVSMVPIRPALSRRVRMLWRTEAARRPAIRAAYDALHAAVPALATR